MTIKKMRLINLRIDDQLLDEIELIAVERFNENTSETMRFLFKLGLKFDAIKPEEIDQEKLKEITDEMNQKVKEETFFDWINSKTPEQQSAIKRWITYQEEEREKH